MANTIRYFRDSVTINQGLISSLIAAPGDTMVFGAREVNLEALSPLFNYVIAANRLTLAPGAATTLQGSDGNPSPAVTVLAASINGLLQVTCRGSNGEDGAPGEAGESGIEANPDGGRPIVLPGGAGGNGENGEPGAPGGTVKIRYASATTTPTGSAPGGTGGRGGAGGPGGAGRPPGKAGRPGHPGDSGVDGTVDIQTVAVATVWQLLDATSARQWAAYRAEVAGYFLRKFDFDSQVIALDESSGALLLNPADPDAAIVQSRIANRQVPSGLPRDLDIAPDYPALAANLTAEIAVVQNAFQSYVSVVSLETISESIRQHLSIMRSQLVNRREEAQMDVTIAQQDVAIAQAEKANIQKQIDNIQNQIEDAQSHSFTIGEIVSTVGAVAGAVMGMSTGVGALISIPAGLAALQRLGETRDLPDLLGELGNAAKDPKHKTSLEQEVALANSVGGDLKDLIKGTKSMISFVKIIAQLDEQINNTGQSAVAKLLKQQAEIVRQKMVAALREKQAQTRVAAAQKRVLNLAEEIADVEQKLAHWTADVAFLSAATDILIRAARRLVDMVMEDVFLAQRAREIYQLEGTPGLRFDFGFLHPDVDRSLTSAQRAAASLISLADMPLQVLSWNQMFLQLNSAQIGFDVIHPQLSLTITDPTQLQAFASGSALTFSVKLEDLPQGMFELKANALHLQMTGASTTQSANVWVTHSGEWSMNRRTGGAAVAISLRPRREVFAIGAGSGTLTSNIPANPQSNSEPGPPFSFWGRGVATTFKLQVAQPSVLNLSLLSALHITLDCIAFAPQATSALVTINPDVQVVAAAPVEEFAFA